MQKSQTNLPEKLWTSNFIKIMIMSFLLSFSFNMQNTALPLYAQYIGGNKSDAGMMMGVFTISALIFRPIFGNLVDTKGRKIILIGGIFLFSIFIFSYGLISSIILLLIIRFLHGIGFSAYTTANGTVVADILPESRLTEGIGYFGISNIIATAIGPTATLFLINNISYKTSFFIFYFVCLLGLMMAFLLNFQKSIEQQGKNTNKKIVIVEKTAMPSSIVVFLIMIPVGAVMTFLPTYALSKGINNIGIFFTVYAIALLITRPIIGRIADRVDTSLILIPGMIFLIINFVILIYAKSIEWFVVAGIFYGFGFGSTQPILNALLIRLSPPERRGTTNATFFSAMDFGVGIGSIAFGVIAQKIGFKAVFILCVVFVIFAIIGYYIFLKKHTKKDTDIVNNKICQAIE
ncbi:MFS transporter [Caldicellulosiruptoraceae bacterium PP1]